MGLHAMTEPKHFPHWTKIRRHNKRMNEKKTEFKNGVQMKGMRKSKVIRKCVQRTYVKQNESIQQGINKFLYFLSSFLFFVLHSIPFCLKFLFKKVFSSVLLQFSGSGFLISESFHVEHENKEKKKKNCWKHWWH